MKAPADLVTWKEAREFLDRRFAQYRYQAIQRISEREPCHRAVALRVIDEQWIAAIAALRAILLPQKRRSHFYRPTQTRNATVGGKPKTRPRASIHLRRARGLTRKQRGYVRSHHKGAYTPKTRRGRPRTISLLPPEKQKAVRADRKRKARAKAKAANDARRKASGLKVYSPRRSKEQRARDDARRRERTLAIRAARAAVSVQMAAKHAARGWGGPTYRFHDDRPNHDPSYAYRRPFSRRRATVKMAAKGQHRTRYPTTLTERLAYSALLIARRAKIDQLRSKHLRGYWEKVHSLSDPALKIFGTSQRFF